MNEKELREEQHKRRGKTIIHTPDSGRYISQGHELITVTVSDDGDWITPKGWGAAEPSINNSKNWEKVSENDNPVFFRNSKHNGTLAVKVNDTYYPLKKHDGISGNSRQTRKAARQKRAEHQASGDVHQVHHKTTNNPQDFKRGRIRRSKSVGDISSKEDQQQNALQVGPVELHPGEEYFCVSVAYGTPKNGYLMDTSDLPSEFLSKYPRDIRRKRGKEEKEFYKNKAERQNWGLVDQLVTPKENSTNN